jgi:hypothetical protein
MNRKEVEALFRELYSKPYVLVGFNPLNPTNIYFSYGDMDGIRRMLKRCYDVGKKGCEKAKVKH